MDSCEFISSVDAYHDGELDEAAARRFEAHLAGCPACQADLRAAQAMSQIMRTRLPAAPQMSDMAVARLHTELNGVMERSLLRLAGSFAAIAAAVLVFATVGLMSIPRTHPVAAPQAWESSAFASQNADSLSTSSATPIEPELIVMDLSRKALP